MTYSQAFLLSTRRSDAGDPVAPPINCAQFLGFSEPTPNISYFTLTDSYIGLSNLTIASSVPKPATLTLLGSGLAGQPRRRALIRRRKANSTHSGLERWPSQPPTFSLRR